ncbi:MAG: enolase C-terminal domain-like protein [Bryobacteraceae bacterium]
MPECYIRAVKTRDARFALHGGAGSDAVHTEPEYCFAYTLLETGGPITGTGMVLTLGEGNRLTCEAIELLGQELVGREIEELMADFGAVSRRIADHPQLRWLGPHKGVVHLALASLTNACFDLWAKSRGVPLWRLLLDLSPAQVVRLLDLSYLEDALTAQEAMQLMEGALATREERMGILKGGYRGYDTSVGWFGYDDAKVADNARRAMDGGFSAFKLKVGSKDGARDVRRAMMLREIVGPDALLMVDVNQQWTLPQAIDMCRALAPANLYWVEEPTHPDDVRAHRVLADEIAPLRVAAGEHIPNRVLFKNFILAGALHFVQVDCTRVAGISEFLTVSLLARKFGLPVVPHVGDMGQVHQHLVLFNHIALGHEALFLEYIPHVKQHFAQPAVVSDGVYQTPQAPGISCDLAD